MINSFLNQIHQGDCLDLLRQIPDESVDMTFADPPFNLKKGYKTYQDNLSAQAYLVWCEAWLREMVRITKPTGSIYVHNIPKWLLYHAQTLNGIADFKHWISWDASSMPTGKTLQPNHYGILFYAKNAQKLTFYEVRAPHKRDRKSPYLSKDYGGKKKSLHPFGSLVSDVWTDIHRIKHNKYRDEHPCQLPTHLLERLILMSTNENDIVLDPFCGTGTTAIAAKRLGRQYIGLELSQEYVDITHRKLAMERANSKLGDSWVSFYQGKVMTLRDKDWAYLQKHFHLPENVADVDKRVVTLR